MSRIDRALEKADREGLLTWTKPLDEQERAHSTLVETIDEGHAVFKVATHGPAFILKDISNAPDLRRLEFTHSVLTHVARSGLQVPVSIPDRAAQLAVNSQGRFYLLSKFIEADDYPSDPEVMPELFYQAGHAIARLHTQAHQHIGKAVGEFVELPIGEIAGLLGLAEPAQGHFVA